MALNRREPKAAPVGELGMRVWDLLVEAARRRRGPSTVTEIMKAGELGRSEVLYGLHELARDGWVDRRVLERERRLCEMWVVVDRDGDQVAAE